MGSVFLKVEVRTQTRWGNVARVDELLGPRGSQPTGYVPVWLALLPGSVQFDLLFYNEIH